MTISVRQSPSGPHVLFTADNVENDSTAPGVTVRDTLNLTCPVAAALLDWNVSGVPVLTVLAAGHAPGVYIVSPTVLVRTAAIAGNFSVVYGFDAPTVGASTLNVGNATLSGGIGASACRSIPSTGAAPITATLTPSGVSGSPSVDVRLSAIPVATL